MRVPWTARISPGCSLEGLMLKLKLQYFGHLMWSLTHWKRPWCWEGLGAGGEGDDRGWDGWMESLDEHEFEWTLGVGDGQGGLAWCNSWSRKELDTTERLNGTELMHHNWRTWKLICPGNNWSTQYSISWLNIRLSTSSNVLTPTSVMKSRHWR